MPRCRQCGDPVTLSDLNGEGVCVICVLEGVVDRERRAPELQGSLADLEMQMARVRGKRWHDI